jgi:serine protease Do
VRLSDNREYDAEVIGTDGRTDLALIKIDIEDAPHLTLGESEDLRVGEDVIAVGNPFGLGGTVTRGIVSALARDIQAGPYVDFIQTDAAINHGNSGGPLLNLDGEVIGVNSAIFSPNGGSVGVGFAIPSDTVRIVVDQLRDHGSVERGWLGVSIQSVTPDLAAAMNLDEAKGALVGDVVKGSPADGVLKAGDVITAFGDAAVEDSRDLPRLVSQARAGDEAPIRVIRDGKAEKLSVTVGKLEPQQTASLTPSDRDGDEASERLGATLAALTPDTRRELGLADDVTGAVVTSVKGDGPAAEAGLRAGDVILRIGDMVVTSPAEAEKALKAQSKAALIQIARGEARLFVGVPLA